MMTDSPAENTGVSGSCLCGVVKYRVNAEVGRVVNCHCGMCRRMNGSAFSSYAVIPRQALEILEDDALGAFAVTERATRHFCTQCGTPIFNLNSKYDGACMVYLGTIENGEVYSPSLNVYCESMLPWLDGVTSIEGLEKGVERRG